MPTKQPDHAPLAVAYLEQRGIPQPDQQRLGIHWVSHDTATTQRYGFGSLATSPDGIIAFPLAAEGDLYAAKNLYVSTNSQSEHLAIINRHRQSQGLSPVHRAPKYILPMGERAKTALYDPYAVLYPGTTDKVQFATEDVVGVIKAALWGARVVSTFGVWLVTAEEMSAGDGNWDWLSHYQDKFPCYLADSDALTNQHVFQALIRTGYRVMVPVGVFPSDDGSKVGLDEYLDSLLNFHAIAGLEKKENSQESLLNFHAIAGKTLDVAKFVQEHLPQVFTVLEHSGLPLSQAANRAGNIHTAVIRELARNVVAPSSFKICFAETLKQIGFQSAEWERICRTIKPNRALDDSPRLLARALVEGELRDRVCYESKLKCWYIYNPQEFCWELSERETVSALVNRAIERTINTGDFDLDLLNDTLHFLRDEVNTRQWSASATHLNLRNGTLELSAQTPLLMEHSPRHFLRHCLPRNWSTAQTETPAIDHFLSQLTGGRDSEVEKIHCFAAAVLRGMVSVQAFLALIGDPGSGKGTLVNLLIELVGRHAVYATTLDAFCANPFDAGNCYGKRLVVFNDCDQYNGGISKFLNFTGGDEVRGEMKGGASFNFKAEGFVIITANKPVFVRSHPGLSRRTVLVNCVKDRQRRSDPLLLNRLADELEAFTAKVLNIPVELIPEVLLDSRKMNYLDQASFWLHLAETDSVAAWADQALTLDPLAETRIGANKEDSAELYGHYFQFCHKAGKTPRGFNVFSSDLLTLLRETMGFEVQRMRKRYTSTSEHTVLIGVRLKDVNALGIYQTLLESSHLSHPPL